MSETPFSVRGKRVVVVGAARSGVAAAELLVRRGASVTLTDVREQIDDEDRLRAASIAGSDDGTPGLSTTRSAPVSVDV